MKTELHIQGTHCKACKMLIEEVGGEQHGIQSITVDFESGNTLIEHDGSVDWQTFKKEVEELGEYTVHLPEEA